MSKHERNDEIIRRYKSGVSRKALAADYNVSKQRITQILSAAGVYKYDDHDNVLLAAKHFHITGCRLEEAEKLFGVAGQRIYAMCRRMNLSHINVYDRIDKAEFIRLYIEKNYSLKETASIMGIPWTRANIFKGMHNIVKYPHHKPTVVLETEQFTELFIRQNLTLKETAKALGVDYGQAMRFAAKHNIRKGFNRRNSPR